MHRILRFIFWIGVAVLGASAVAVAAIDRGEPVNALWLVVAGGCTFAVAYRFYSAWLVAKVRFRDLQTSTGENLQSSDNESWRIGLAANSYKTTSVKNLSL